MYNTIIALQSQNMMHSLIIAHTRTHTHTHTYSGGIIRIISLTVCMGCDVMIDQQHVTLYMILSGRTCVVVVVGDERDERWVCNPYVKIWL